MTKKRNSLSPKEVAIIKKLLKLKRFQNQEIAGMVNRSRGEASKDVSTGRISNIKNNQIQKYNHISPASDAEVEKFIRDYKSAQFSQDNLTPLGESTLVNLLPLSQCGTKLNITETSRIECKENWATPLKTIAAFANNNGGYIVLGVKNGTWEIVGVKEKKIKKYDLNKLNQDIRSGLGVFIDVNFKILEFSGKFVVVFYIPPAHTKPVIMIRSTENYTEGAIYFRYPGEDRLIGPSELNFIIEERVRLLSQTVLQKHLSTILRIGIENAAILDLASGEVEGKAGSFLISKEILPELSFIKEGEFSEKVGAPTLKLIGNLESAKATRVHLVPEDVMRLYNLDYADVFHAVKSKIANVKQGDINEIIKVDGIKVNNNFAHPIFTSEEKQRNFNNTGTLPMGVKVRYNDRAVEHIVSRIAESRKKHD